MDRFQSTKSIVAEKPFIDSYRLAKQVVPYSERPENSNQKTKKLEWPVGYYDINERLFYLLLLFYNTFRCSWRFCVYAVTVLSAICIVIIRLGRFAASIII